MSNVAATSTNVTSMQEHARKAGQRARHMKTTVDIRGALKVIDIALEEGPRRNLSAAKAAGRVAALLAKRSTLEVATQRACHWDFECEFRTIDVPARALHVWREVLATEQGERALSRRGLRLEDGALHRLSYDEGYAGKRSKEEVDLQGYLAEATSRRMGSGASFTDAFEGAAVAWAAVAIDFER